MLEEENKMSENLTKAKKALEDENYEELAVEANKVCNIDGDYKTGIELLSKGLAKQQAKTPQKKIKDIHHVKSLVV